jgi:hypothetical protein
LKKTGETRRGPFTLGPLGLQQQNPGGGLKTPPEIFFFINKRVYIRQARHCFSLWVKDIAFASIPYKPNLRKSISRFAEIFHFRGIIRTRFLARHPVAQFQFQIKIDIIFVWNWNEIIKFKFQMKQDNRYL